MLLSRPMCGLLDAANIVHLSHACGSKAPSSGAWLMPWAKLATRDVADLGDHLKERVARVARVQQRLCLLRPERQSAASVSGRPCQKPRCPSSS